MNTINKTISEIRQLFISQGNDQYFGENISQFEHAAQAALLAKKQGFDKEVQLAAFLHDIGHLLPISKDDEVMENYGRKNHESIAADWLRERGFSEKIAFLVESHVKAKRYLCFQSPVYFQNLSDASKKTLEFQGGAMQRKEAEKFERNPLFDTIIRMRRWDEAAKIPDMQLPDLEYFMNICENYLNQFYLDKTLNETFY